VSKKKDNWLIPVVAILICLLAAAFLLSSLLFSESADNSQPGIGPLKINPKTLVSSPLTIEQLKVYSDEQGLDYFYWLGVPKDDEDMRVDTAAETNSLSLGYTTKEQREEYQQGKPATFNNLINSVKIGKNRQGMRKLEKEMRKEAVSIISGRGGEFKVFVFLPPYATFIGADIILLSNDYTYLGRVAAGSDELVIGQRKNELMQTARNIELASTG